MEQGYFVEFYARTSYIKQIKTQTGTPFVVGTLSAYVYKHGYTNIKFKCFGDIALQIEEKQWLKGKGILGYNVAKNQEDYKQLEIVIEEFEIAEQPPFKDYSSQKQQNYSYKPKVATKPKTDTKELEDEIFNGIDIDPNDFPF